MIGKTMRDEGEDHRTEIRCQPASLPATPCHGGQRTEKGLRLLEIGGEKQGTMGLKTIGTCFLTKNIFQFYNRLSR
jgi:hypothetical protein